MIIAAVLLVVVGAIWGGAMKVFGDTGAAWLGSVGTISTLAFLIYQNTSQAKEIREERAKREAHEAKQQNMWNEQREMLVFQKLQTHKSLFNDLLDELESSYTVTFIDRSDFYKKIFPDNNFYSFSVDCDSVNVLCRTRNVLDKTFEQLSNTSEMYSFSFVKHHLHSIKDVCLNLHLRLPNDKLFGDVILHPEQIVVTNVFNSLEFIIKYQNILKRLCDFSGITYDTKNPQLQTTFYSRVLFDFALKFPTSDKGRIKIELGNIKSAIKNIDSVVTEISNKDLTQNQKFAYYDIIQILKLGLHYKNEADVIRILIKSTNKLIESLTYPNTGHISDSQAEIVTSTPQSPPFYSELCTLQDVIKELKDRGSLLSAFKASRDAFCNFE